MKPIVALIVGIALGYPLSYLFQSELLRAKCPFFPDYFKSIGDVLGAVNSEMPSIGWTAIGTMAACGIILCLLSVVLSRKN